MRTYPTFAIEQKYWNNGYLVIGIDEVGRGPLAGPLTMGAACFDCAANPDLLKSIPDSGINDSKLLSHKKRCTLDPFIRTNSLAYSICSASTEEINTYGISRTINKLIVITAQKILQNLPKIKSYVVVVDGIYKPKIGGIKEDNVISLIDGDALSYTIAAASIIAKVERDTYMTQQATEYDKYGWERNKGYGTKEHIRAIKNHGPTPQHRTAFIQSFLD